MTERKLLPAQKDSTSMWLTTLIALLFIGVAQVSLITSTLGALFLGQFITASFFAVGALLFLWFTGSIYIALPLNLYFHTKYSSVDSNYSQIDMVHRRSINLLKRLPFRRHLTIAVSLSNLGILRLCQGNYESAADLFSEATSYLETTKGAVRNMSMIVFYNNLAVAYLRQNKFIEAELIATKALEVAELPSMQSKYKKLTGAPLSVLAAVRLRLGELESALDYGRQAMDKYDNSPNPQGYSDATFVQAKFFCLLGMALCSIRLGNESESIQYYEQGLPLAKANKPLLTTLALELLNLLANEYLNKQLFAQAEELLELAYSIGRDNPFHPDSKQTLNYFEKMLLLTQRQAEITDMRSWLRHVDERKAITQIEAK